MKKQDIIIPTQDAARLITSQMVSQTGERFEGDITLSSQLGGDDD